MPSTLASCQDQSAIETPPNRERYRSSMLALSRAHRAAGDLHHQRQRGATEYKGQTRRSHGTYAVEIRDTVRSYNLWPENGRGRTRFRQSPEQGNATIHSSRKKEGQRAVELLTIVHNIEKIAR